MEKKKKRQRKRKKKRTFVKGRRCFLEWNVVVYGSRPKAKRYSRDRQTEVNLTFFFSSSFLCVRVTMGNPGMPGAISDHIMYYIILPPRGIPRPGPRVKKRKAEEKQKRSLPRVTIPLLAYFRPDPLADCRLVCFFSSACCLFVCVLQALIACSSPELDYHQHDFIGIRNAMPWELALAGALSRGK